MVDSQTLLVNLLILLALIVTGVVGLLLFLASWTGIKACVWHARRRRAEEQLDRLRAYGTPTGRGLCDRCGRAFDEVYFLSSGQRRCAACYEREPDV